MPLYEMFALLRADAKRTAVVSTLRGIGERVCDAGGVVTDVTSYGQNALAYRIKKPDAFHYNAHITSLSFVAPPSVVPEVDNALKLDSLVVRHVLRRMKQHETLTETRRRVGLLKGTDRFSQSSRYPRHHGARGQDATRAHDAA